MNIKQKKNVKQEIKTEKRKTTESLERVFFYCPVIGLDLAMVYGNPTHPSVSSWDWLLILQHVVSLHGHREGWEVEKGEEKLQASKWSKAVQTPTATGELLERTGLQGTEGLHKELRMLLYLFGIRGDAPYEDDMPPAKQKEEPLTILFSVLT